MSTSKKIFFAIASTSCLLFQSGCLPVMVAGGGAATVTTAAKEKGISGTMSDSQISTVIKSRIYQKDRDYHKRVGVSVQNSEVLLTGSLPSQEAIQEVEEIVWGVSGVTKIMNEMGVDKEDSFPVGEIASDGVITTRIKSAILFDGDIKSINYSIKTVSGVVYITGIAQNQAELDKVLEAARTTRGVKKVKNYVKIKPDTGQPSDDESSSEEKPEDESNESNPSAPKKESPSEKSASSSPTENDDVDVPAS